MPSRKDTTLLSPNPRRHVRNASAPTKHHPPSHATPVSILATPSLPDLPLPNPAESYFSQSTPFTTPTSSSRANNAASKIITTVRKSFSHSSSKKRQAESSKNDASFIEEQNSRIAFTPSQYRFQDAASTRPTVEQIAMGLHVSRTPHLRPVSKNQRLAAPASNGSQDGLPPRVHAPPPSRSSLKKSSTLTNSSTMTPPTNSMLSAASVSNTTITSVTPSVAKSARSLTSLKTRMMTRFLPSVRSLAVPLSDSESDTPSGENGLLPPRRKAVRFTTSTDEKAH